MRRRYSSSRRFANPVNYLWWQPNTYTEGNPDQPFPGEHQWVNANIGSNDAPIITNVAALSYDTPEQTRYGSISGAATWDESPDNVGQRVPLNARLLWTTGTVHVNLSCQDTTLVRVAIFDQFTDPAAGTQADPTTATTSAFGNWFWTNDTSIMGQRAHRRPNSPWMPIWWRDAIFVPKALGASANNGLAHKAFKVKLRHPTGNVRNSDSSAMVLVIGTRTRGGSTYPLGADYMTLLKTSYVV